MHRVKNVQYSADDLYPSDEDEDLHDDAQQQDSYTAKDRQNFAGLTPVVRAELEEAALSATDREIEDALWHYYWDVAKSVAYLKNGKATKGSSGAKKTGGEGSNKKKSRFDEAVERSAVSVGE